MIMRKKTWSLLLVMLVVSLTSLADSRPPRQITIGKNCGQLTAGTTEIVIVPKACPVIQLAAQELKNALDKVLSGPVPVVKEISPGKTSFILGDNSWSREAGLQPMSGVRDSFIIRNIPGRIFILGTDDPKLDPLSRGLDSFHERGTLFGVYYWLERFAGVRYYFYGDLGTVLPKKEQLPYPEAEIFERPDFTHRSIAIHGTMPGDPSNDIVTARKYLNLRWAQETCLIPHCHGMNVLGYPERFSEKHPEYMALMADGTRHTRNTFRPHFCYSSGIREEIYQDAASFLRGEPASIRGPIYRNKIQWFPKILVPGYFDMMPDDSFKGCQCDECRKHWTDSENYASEYLWEFVAECANRLKKEDIKGNLTMMAYYPYRDVPKVEIPDNVLVKLAELGPWGLNNPDGQKRDKDEIIEWSKKVGRDRLRMWVYLCKFGVSAFPDIPSPSPVATGEYFKEMAPYISGAYLESETDRYINNYLTHYVYAKVAWNNQTDVQLLVAEHHELMFGGGAWEMAELFLQYEEFWLRRVVGRTTFGNLGPVVSPPSDDELWNQIYTEEELQSMAKLFDTAEKKAAGDINAVNRIRLFRSEWLEPLTKRRQTYMINRTARDDLKLTPGNQAVLALFTAREKMAGRSTTRTEVSFTRNGDDLVFVFDCEEPRLAEAVSVSRKPDDFNIWRDSGVELFLNPSGDRKTGFQIIVNLSGSISDRKFIRDGLRDKESDWSWSSETNAVLAKEENRFRITLHVPIKNLGFINPEGFPVDFCRNRTFADTPVQENYSWSAALIKQYGDIENFGVLCFRELPPNNLLDNGDFIKPSGEGGKSHGLWHGARPDTFTKKWFHQMDRSEFFTGGQSLKLATDGKVICVTQFIKGMKPATAYRLSYFIKMQDVKPLQALGGMYVQLKYGGKKWYPRIPLYGTSGWNKQYFEFTTPAEADPAPYIELRSLNATGTAWFDHVELVELSKK